MVRPKIPLNALGRSLDLSLRQAVTGEALMHWELSDEQELFTTSLREWLGERASLQAVRGWLDTGDSAAFERLFVDEGWAGVGFDEDLGGQGGGLLELALTARDLARAAAPSATWLQSAIVVSALGAEPALVQAASESGEITALAVRADRITAAAPSVPRRPAARTCSVRTWRRAVAAISDPHSRWRGHVALAGRRRRWGCRDLPPLAAGPLAGCRRCRPRQRRGAPARDRRDRGDRRNRYPGSGSGRR